MYMMGTTRRMGRLGVALIDNGNNVSRFRISTGLRPIDIVNPRTLPGSPGSTATPPIIANPIGQQPLPPGVTVSPYASGSSANAGTPVPAGYPTSQIYVDSTGGFWEYSSAQGQWINVGTPYNTGASAVSAPSVSPSPVSTSAPTTAPVPVSVDTTAAAAPDPWTSLLTWLQGDDLGSTVGFTSIPNWLVVAAAGFLALKISNQQKSSRRNPARRRRARNSVVWGRR